MCLYKHLKLQNNLSETLIKNRKRRYKITEKPPDKTIKLLNCQTYTNVIYTFLKIKIIHTSKNQIQVVQTSIHTDTRM